MKIIAVSDIDWEEVETIWYNHKEDVFGVLEPQIKMQYIENYLLNYGYKTRPIVYSNPKNKKSIKGIAKNMKKYHWHLICNL